MICQMNARCLGCERAIGGSVPDSTCATRADCALKSFDRSLSAVGARPAPGDDLVRRQDVLDLVEMLLAQPTLDEPTLDRVKLGVMAATRVGSALPGAAASGREDDEFAWLIEDANRPGPWYYAGVEWTTDHMKAIRHTRREEAERAIMGLPHGWHLIGRAVEHGWTSLGARAAPRPGGQAAGQPEGA